MGRLEGWSLGRGDLAKVNSLAPAELLKLGDSVTTDHIALAGSIKADSPAGQYLAEHGVARADFSSYGSRRGNHEVMTRRHLRQHLAPRPGGAGHRGRPEPGLPPA